MISIMAILEFLYSTMLKQLKLKTLSFFAGRGVRNPGFHTRRGNLTPLLAFSVCIVFWAYEGDVVAFIHQTQIEMAESLRCILGQSTLLSQCLSSPRSINGTWYLKKKKKRENRKKIIWTYETRQNLFEHMKVMSQLKAHKNIHADGQEARWNAVEGEGGGGNHGMDWYPIQEGREVIILVTSCCGKHSLQCRRLIRAS